MKKITVVVGSNNNNLALANKFSEAITQQGAEVHLVNLVELNLPLYSPVAEAQGIPNAIVEQVTLLQNSDAMIWVGPEYNGGIPPVMTNYIAWISRSGDGDWRSCFKYKRAAIASHSGGGGYHMLMELRTQLSYIGMNVIGHQVVVNATKELNTDSLNAIVSQLV